MGVYWWGLKNGDTVKVGMFLERKGTRDYNKLGVCLKYIHNTTQHKWVGCVI
jgi:hypothetical protein